MLNQKDIISTIEMIDQQHLDIRTITMGISLLSCCDPDAKRACDKIYEKITRYAEKLVKTGEDIERDFGIPISGTMAHSWVQFHENELEAFKSYARQYPDSCTLLIDTYNVMNSGLPNAIRTFDEVLKPLGKRPAGVRIDSGDITDLSKKIRRELDEAGYADCKIIASNSLD